MYAQLARSSEPEVVELNVSEQTQLIGPLPPTASELAGFNIGTSLAATVRGFWEQTGNALWPAVKEDDLKDENVRGSLLDTLDAHTR